MVSMSQIRQREGSTIKHASDSRAHPAIGKVFLSPMEYAFSKLWQTPTAKKGICTPFPNGDKRKRPKKAEKKLCHSIKIIPKYTKELVKHHPLDFIFIVEAQLAVAGSDAGKGRHRLRAAGRRRRRRRRRRAPPPSPAAAPTRLRGACSGGAAGAMEKIVPQTPLRNSWESRRRERCPQRPQPLGNIATRPYAPVDELGPN